MRLHIPASLRLRLACGALLCACLGAHAQTPAPGAMAARNAQVRALAALYMKSLSGDAALRPLWRKTTLTPNEATPGMLARTDHAGAPERAMLREVARRLADYQTHMAQLLREQGLAAPLVQQWEEGAQAANALRAQLHNGTLTWGEYNLRLRDVTTAQRLALADSADALEAKDAEGAEHAGQAARVAYAEALQQAASAVSNSTQCEVIGGERYCS
jgi:hypothetical protein